MPNHLHAILELTELDPTQTGKRAALWEIVRVFKAATSYHIRHAEGQPWFAWQEDYYEAVICTEEALQQIRRLFLESAPLEPGQVVQALVIAGTGWGRLCRVTFECGHHHIYREGR